MLSLNWFNVGAPRWNIFGRNVWLWNLFNRRSSDGDHWWGFGLLQVGNHHLFFVGHCGVSIGFIGQTS